jgi:NAD(P)H dehydrogenase (quinone)
VRAIIRDASKAASLAQSGSEIAVADIRAPEELRRALVGANDVLVICPTNPSAEDAAAEQQRMIEAVAEALEHMKPRSVVAISDYGAQHSSGTGITITFHRLEERLRSIPTRWTVLRSAEHMENWSRFLKNAAKSGLLPTFYRPKTKLLPIVSARDVGIVAADLLASSDRRGENGQVVYVEGPRRYSVDEVRQTMEVVAGRPIEGRELPPEKWVSALTQGGLSESYARLVAETYSAHNAGRIDIESEFSDVRRGKTSLVDALSSLTHE